MKGINTQRFYLPYIFIIIALCGSHSLAIATTLTQDQAPAKASELQSTIFNYLLDNPELLLTLSHPEIATSSLHEDNIHKHFMINLDHSALTPAAGTEIHLSKIIDWQWRNTITNSFKATGEDSSGKRIVLVGKIVRLIMVPVLRRDLKRGESITPDHWELRSMPQDKLTSSTLLNPAELNGSVIRVNEVLANSPVKSSEVEINKAIRKNQLIKIRVLAPGLSIDAAGKALQDGKIGDTISVQNTSSNKKILGVVSAPGIVDLPFRLHYEKE